MMQYLDGDEYVARGDIEGSNNLLEGGSLDDRGRKEVASNKRAIERILAEVLEMKAKVNGLLDNDQSQ